MRKGERLIMHLSEMFPILDSVDLPSQNRQIVRIIYNMTDEKFDEIINEDK